MNRNGIERLLALTSVLVVLGGLAGCGEANRPAAATAEPAPIATQMLEATPTPGKITKALIATPAPTLSPEEEKIYDCQPKEVLTELSYSQAIDLVNTADLLDSGKPKFNFKFNEEEINKTRTVYQNAIENLPPEKKELSKYAVTVADSNLGVNYQLTLYSPPADLFIKTYHSGSLGRATGKFFGKDLNSIFFAPKPHDAIIDREAVDAYLQNLPEVLREYNLYNEINKGEFQVKNSGELYILPFGQYFAPPIIPGLQASLFIFDKETCLTFAPVRMIDATTELSGGTRVAQANHFQTDFQPHDFLTNPEFISARAGAFTELSQIITAVGAKESLIQDESRNNSIGELFSSIADKRSYLEYANRIDWVNANDYIIKTGEKISLYKFSEPFYNSLLSKGIKPIISQK